LAFEGKPSSFVVMLSAADQRRRWFGSFFLILAGGMLFWGFTFLNGPLTRNPFLFLFYWFVCFVFAALALCVAMYDMRIIRRRTQEEQRRIFEKAFNDVSEGAPEKSSTSETRPQ
jgi:hypothetical protein